MVYCCPSGLEGKLGFGESFGMKANGRVQYRAGAVAVTPGAENIIGVGPHAAVIGIAAHNTLCEVDKFLDAHSNCHRLPTRKYCILCW